MPMFSMADVQTRGKNFAATVAQRRTGDELFVGQRSGLEELLHERFVDFRHHLDERFAGLIDGASQVGGNAPSVNLPVPSV